MALIPAATRNTLGRRSPDHAPVSIESVRLIPVESASAFARPNAVEQTYLELAHDKLALEQHHLFAAEGEARCRADMAAAKSLAYAVAETKASVARAAVAADKAFERYEQLRDLLGCFMRRKATSARGYMARTAALLLGDIAGLSGAAIALGEYPVLAVAQAMSAGTATVTAGLAATQLRHMQQAVDRQQDVLPQDLEPYRHLFGGPPKGKRLQATVFGVAALVTLLLSVGIFALRTTVEGPISGLTFGGLAAAIALASFINSWYYADAVADIIESAYHEAVVADRRHRRLAGSRSISRAEHAETQQKSIVTEYTHRGLAAAGHIEANKYRALLASPDVVGHGPAATPPAAKPVAPTRRARSA
ncbi:MULTISPECIES: hypothetical protein [Mycobacteriaceae]|uniref:Uncharacterized protein n=1 Tax=Mycolicibacterium parafortuitum TaxID=39692 RepID=A0ACC6MF22_MYCPF|nr:MULTISPECIES: hypothetical protein [Mycobacteriaceae]MDZ5085221.1 hypothetical protein [Mycolicibacterium parafortuitum]